MRHEKDLRRRRRVSRAFKFNLALIVAGIIVAGVVAPILPSIWPNISCPGPNPCLVPDPETTAVGIAMLGLAVLTIGVALEIVRRREDKGVGAAETWIDGTP